MARKRKPAAATSGNASARAGQRTPSLGTRSAGILLHPTSLPGPHGNGDLGASARAFVDFLAKAGQTWWQMLPVGPAGAGNSPYSGVSAFAGNPLLISLDDLAEDGLLDRSTADGIRLRADRVDYPSAHEARTGALREATARLRKRMDDREAFERFLERERAWLSDYALFMALRRRYEDAPWTTWDAGIAKREPSALESARRELSDEIAHNELEQYLFDRQWRALRSTCAARGIGLIGDAPIFVDHESADVWAHQRYFRLDEQGESTHVAGVPPDYFSKTGQRWGNPLYRWKRLARDGYPWWVERVACLLRRFDVVRLDHFIGFARYWEVPATEPTAENGRWMKGPGAGLFDQLARALGPLPLIAEDLGEVTPKVIALRDRFALPGMRILQFAFGGDAQASCFLPHSYVPRTVAYTGTHDNDTIRGWLEDEGGGAGNPRSAEQAEKERQAAIRYVAGPMATDLGKEPHWHLIRAVYASVAALAVIPLQDALGLDNGARMNTPGTADGNWEWRVDDSSITAELAGKLRALAETYGRARAAA